jgi:tRNA(Met) cytidine acetyltransferase
LTHGEHVLAATMVAIEGGLEEKTCDDLYWGRCRIRGHALPETLSSHSGERDAGSLAIIRSVRIAVHPTLRRRGLATQLIGHVHDTYQPDLFGTLFGLSPGLLQFRRSAGYELVRVGASRGTRTGEPAVVMMRPVSARAGALFQRLRMKLARQLNAQIELMQAGNELLLPEDLIADLNADLPAPLPLSANERMEGVKLFAEGPRTQEAACVALYEFASEHADALSLLTPGESALIQGRILDGRGWEAAADAADLPSVPAAMRALRRAMRALVRHVMNEQES